MSKANFEKMGKILKNRQLSMTAKLRVFVGETRHALSEETHVSPRAVGYSSCAVAVWG